MKKIFFAICFVFMVQFFAKTSAFADEIIDGKGQIIPCKLETVSAGLIEYIKDGSLYSFHREKDAPIFNDYVDVRSKLFRKNSIVRYYGKILLRDAYGLKIRNKNGDIAIPWYRVKFVGIYKP